MNYIIITNNPLVQSTYPSENIIRVDNYLDVLMMVRDHIHKGARLLSHPQAGSIKPYETPYRSVVVSKDPGALDFKSLDYIESAIERFNSLTKSMGLRAYDEHLLNDFQTIDASLIQNTINLLDR